MPRNYTNPTSCFLATKDSNRSRIFEHFFRFLFLLIIIIFLFHLIFLLINLLSLTQRALTCFYSNLRLSLHFFVSANSTPLLRIRILQLKIFVGIFIFSVRTIYLLSTLQFVIQIFMQTTAMQSQYYCCLTVTPCSGILLSPIISFIMQKR